jgi:uncharacterized protein
MVDQRFLNGDTWGFPGSAVEHIETHAAHVFLCSDRAFKIKKNVKLPYLDFSTVEKRKSILERELEISRTFAASHHLHRSRHMHRPDGFKAGDAFLLAER